MLLVTKCLEYVGRIHTILRLYQIPGVDGIHTVLLVTNAWSILDACLAAGQEMARIGWIHTVLLVTNVVGKLYSLGVKRNPMEGFQVF